MLDSLPFRELWAVDFEFVAKDGEHPDVVCMVALELRSGRCLRYWRDELERMSVPPFPVDGSVLYIAYANSAEYSCHLVLGWPLPVRAFDCYVEFRRLTNGRPHKLGAGLLAAMSAFGLDAMTVDRKRHMRDRILSGGPYSAQDQRDILDYCEEDVRALEQLFPRMLPVVVQSPEDRERALLRGRYISAVARMEHTGVPIDRPLFDRLATDWHGIQERLIADVDSAYGIYDGRTFKADRFADYLRRERIPWPRLESGALRLDGDTFRQMAKAYPQVSPLRELRHALGEMRLNRLAVGHDNRNRTSLFPFGSKTGRNQPSTTKYIFGPSTWLRGLIRPEHGRALAYVDWAAQEVAIAAALSGDAPYMDAYSGGDIYIAFAKTAGLVPPDATKATHKSVRDMCKPIILGANYGMGPEALANIIGGPVIRARQLQDAHRQAYPTLCRWLDAAADSAMLLGRIDTVFGWRLHIEGDGIRRGTLLNFPCQANGAEMMRLACIAATESGLNICAPVHDALLLEAAADDIAEHVAELRAIMEDASRQVLGGFTVRTDAEIIRAPDRYADPRGAVMWSRVMDLLNVAEPTERVLGGVPIALERAS
jgi:hypothetical protein